MKDREVESERKHATVLFSDLSEYTTIAKRLDPEDTKEIMGRIFKEIEQIAKKYEGKIERFFGDEAMVIFGVPDAHEDDPIRAILVANEIHDIVDKTSHKYQSKIGQPLKMHIGINTGLLVTGDEYIGKERHGLTGDSVNVAARLSKIAKPGETLIGPNTYRLSKGYFSFEKIGLKGLKGSRESLDVYKISSRKSKLNKISYSKDFGSNFIGREIELAKLQKALDQILNKKGGYVVFILGDAGIGKSRFVSEIRNKIKTKEFNWLEGRAISYGQSISYWPFQEMIKTYAGIADKDSDEEVWLKLGNLSKLFPYQWPEMLPYVATMLAMDKRKEVNDLARYLDGEAIKHQIFRATKTFFKGVAQEKPIILEFEDFHWADRSSMSLLEHLLPLVFDVPILILCVGRPEMGSPISELKNKSLLYYPDRSIEIGLLPLTEGEINELTTNVLMTQDIHPQIHDLILQKTDGNPLFTIEIINLLFEMGVIESDKVDTNLYLNEVIEEIIIPDTLRGIFDARIDRLEEDLKRLLRIASVIGRSFLLRVLAYLSESTNYLDKHLDELKSREFIREKKRIPELEYIFKHSLVRDAVYESILLKQRMELHRSVAETIEVLFSERLEEFDGIIAYHYTNAREWEKAQKYLLKAGDQACRIASDDEALNHYQCAIDAFNRAFGDKWDPIQKAMLERKMGEALFRLGKHEEAINFFYNALRLFEYPLPNSRWGIRIDLAKNAIKQFIHRMTPKIKKKLSDKQDESIQEIWIIYEMLGWIDFFYNHERLLLITIKALNLSEKENDINAIARASTGLGFVCDIAGQFRLAKYYHVRSFNLAKVTKNPKTLGLSFLGMGLHKDYIGHWDSAIKFYKRSEDCYFSIGEIRKWGNPFILSSLLHLFKGEFNIGLERFQKAAKLGEDSSDKQLLGWSLQGIGLTYLCFGNFDDAISNLINSIELLFTVPDYYVVAMAESDLAISYLYQNKIDKAVTHLEESIKHVEKYKLMGVHMAIVYNQRAEVYLRLAESTKKDKNRALSKAKRACNQALRISKRFCLGRPYAFRLTGNYHYLTNRPAFANRWWHKSIAAANELGAKYELGKTYLAMGRLDGDVSNLEKAKSIFNDIGVDCERF